MHKELLVSVGHHTAISSVALALHHFHFLPLEVTPLEPPTHFIYQLGSAGPFSLAVLFLFSPLLRL